ncbi:hypothetical protein LINPERHAP2_LOCUS43585 [Linum perenne]
MARKQSNVGRRAWNILRLALLWARKGGVFKRRLMVDLRLVPKFIKSLAHTSSSSSSEDQRSRIGFYGERELSFDKTPLFQVKMHRPASMRFIIPCITPQKAEFEYDFDEFCGGKYGDENVEVEEEQPSASSSIVDDDSDDDDEDELEEGGEGIDSKAEKFIAQFYEQMKLQRQISYLEYKK